MFRWEFVEATCLEPSGKFFQLTSKETKEIEEPAHFGLRSPAKALNAT